jgi:acyl-CoA thioesterase
MAAPILIDANTWAAHWRMVESELDYTCRSLDLTVWLHDLGAASARLLLDAVAPTAGDDLVHGAVAVWTADGAFIATDGSQCLATPLPSPVG